MARSGFDFIELDLRELVGMEEAQFRQTRSRLADVGLGADACSWVLPVELDLTSQATRFADWRGYVEKGAQRSALLGTAVWPLGSGKGRSLKPGNGPAAEQEARFADFVAKLADVAGAFGIAVAVEPLGPSYSNYLGTIGQAAEFADRLRRANVGAMCDLRHMTASGDGLEAIERWGDHLLHAHIDLPTGERRLFPRPDDGWDYEGYLQSVRRSRVPRLSIEALHEADLGAGACSVTYLRELLEKTAKQ